VTQVASAPRLRREPEAGIVGGVCAGLGRYLGIDPILLRVGLAILCVATFGGALIAYAIAWALIPPDRGDRVERAEDAPSVPRPARLRRGGWRVAAGVGLLTLAALLVVRELGVWWSDAVVWPLVLASAGAALLWRQSRTATAAPAAEPAGAAPTLSVPRRTALAGLYRGGFGIALVVGAALLFLSANDALGATRDVVFAALAVLVAVALILAPLLWRLGRNLAAERAERIRSQERAEVAAHLHDSVLQTLTLMQKRADNPREVASLARRQERELRSWLFGDAGARRSDSVAAALEAAAAEVEEAHGTPVEVVAVGDRGLDREGEALVAAAREAITNAAKFAPEAGPVRVYAELGQEGSTVFVRDRGPGFDPTQVPADRRGLRESIVARMERHGGRATVRSAPGEGTEIELAIEKEPA
jgi:signal transduction histidine kinase/phage shock protein PspC (stress-responsive transcriptional regulator)